MCGKHKVILAQVVSVPVCQHLGGRLPMTLVATINDIIVVFSFLFSVIYFSHRRNAQIKVDGSAQNLEVDTFPEPIGHFGAPHQQFWIFHAVQHCKR